MKIFISISTDHYETDLFTALMKDRKGSADKPRSTITVDAAANRIIITGNKDEINEIHDLDKRHRHLE